MDNEAFVLSARIKSTGEQLYLATRRNPREPRKFKRIDIAIGTANKLLGAKRFVVILD
jgi:hypothetical protein